MKKLALAVVIAGAASMTAPPAFAACSLTTSGIIICVPNLGDRGDIWARDMIQAFETLSASAAALGSGTTAHFVKINVDEIGALLRTDIKLSTSVTFVAGSTLTLNDAMSIGGTFYVKNGRVGIGTDSPGEKLHLSTGTLLIDGSTSRQAILEGAAASSSGILWRHQGDSATGFEINMTSDESARLWHWDAEDIYFGTTNIERMRIQAGGNVGIGTASPGSLLEVGPGSITLNGLEIHNLAGVVAIPAGVKADLTGNADTATALAANPSACGAGQYVSDQDASGNLTCSTPSGAGDANLNADQSWTGLNTHVLSTTKEGGLTLGTTDFDTIADGFQEIAIYATSVDGATQSSGCIVAVKMDGNLITDSKVFTSSTTLEGQDKKVQGIIPGVLLETCAQDALCKVGIRGIYHVVGDVDVQGYYPDFDNSKRCAVGITTNNLHAIGRKMGTIANDAGGGLWISLGL